MKARKEEIFKMRDRVDERKRKCHFLFRTNPVKLEAIRATVARQWRLQF